MDGIDRRIERYLESLRTERPRGLWQQDGMAAYPRAEETFVRRARVVGAGTRLSGSGGVWGAYEDMPYSYPCHMSFGRWRSGSGSDPVSGSGVWVDPFIDMEHVAGTQEFRIWSDSDEYASGDELAAIHRGNHWEVLAADGGGETRARAARVYAWTMSGYKAEEVMPSGSSWAVVVSGMKWDDAVPGAEPDIVAFPWQAMRSGWHGAVLKSERDPDKWMIVGPELESTLVKVTGAPDEAGIYPVAIHRNGKNEASTGTGELEMLELLPGENLPVDSWVWAHGGLVETTGGS
jgi:hypothetical protein